MRVRLAYTEDKTGDDGDEGVDRSILLSVELKTLGEASVGSGL